MIALNVISFMYSFWQLILLGRYGEYSTYSRYDKLLSMYIGDQVNSLAHKSLNDSS